MRRILSMMLEVRELQLKRHAQETRVGEVRDMFKTLDGHLMGYGHNEPLNKVEEIMTSADFQYALIEWVQRLMIPGYEQKVFAFEPLVKPDTLPNFLPVSRYQSRAGVDDLEYVGEKGTARVGSKDDAVKKQYRVYKWEKLFDFSMEALVNDDLGYFADTARDMGRAARRTLEKYVSRLYSNATTIARLVGLGALYSTTGRITSARVSTARMAFNQRTDDRGEPIRGSLVYIVHHTGLTDQVDTILNSIQVPELATNAINVVRRSFTPIEDPYLTGTAPNLPWYAFTDYRRENLIPFILARRQGVPAPLIMRKKTDIEVVTSLLGGGQDAPPIWGDFTTGNVTIKVHDEWGTYIDETEGNLFDYRGAYYSSGTAA